MRRGDFWIAHVGKGTIALRYGAPPQTSRSRGSCSPAPHPRRAHGPHGARDRRAVPARGGPHRGRPLRRDLVRLHPHHLRPRAPARRRARGGARAPRRRDRRIGTGADPRAPHGARTAARALPRPEHRDGARRESLSQSGGAPLARRRSRGVDRGSLYTFSESPVSDNVIHVRFGPGGGRRVGPPEEPPIEEPKPRRVEATPPEKTRGGEPYGELFARAEVSRL